MSSWSPQHPVPPIPGITEIYVTDEYIGTRATITTEESRLDKEDPMGRELEIRGHRTLGQCKQIRVVWGGL